MPDKDSYLFHNKDTDNPQFIGQKKYACVARDWNDCGIYLGHLGYGIPPGFPGGGTQKNGIF
jgi:hypothetical protein